jgi:hypothetical protein
LGGSVTILVVFEQRELKGALEGVKHRWVTFVEGIVHQEVLIGYRLGQLTETHHLWVSQDVVQGELFARVGHSWAVVVLTTYENAKVMHVRDLLFCHN